MNFFEIHKYPSRKNFPVYGNINRLYIDLESNKFYYWEDGKYFKISTVELDQATHDEIDRKLSGTYETIVNSDNKLALKADKSYVDDIVDSLDVIAATTLVEVTWQELKDKRDLGLLTPGAQYRITDYECTTTQANTRSAGHQFDIIVTADDVDKLNENARACLHEKELLPWFEHNQSDPVERYFYVDSVVIEGLTLYRWLSYEESNNDVALPQYLLTDKRDVSIGDIVWGYQVIDDGNYASLEYEEGSDAIRTIINVGEGYMSGLDYFDNSKLEAWKLKYCLDNDTSRFAWADEVNGKGVIYRMVDEFNNDVPYDFKNIQFKRKLTDGELDLDSGIDTWVYTFTGISYDYFTLVDGTVLKASEYFTDEGSNLYKNNKIGIYEYKRFFEDGYDNIVQQCNDIVFIGRYDEEPYVEEGPAKLVLFSYDNVFGAQCYNMTFGANCYFNTFGNGCDSNTFGNDCCYNTFGNYCYSNTFGNYCYSNTFGDYCRYNTFGNYCYYNTFGNYCYSNTFGNYCSSNTFGNACRYLKISDVSTTQKKYIHVENGMQGASFNNKFELYDPAILNKNYQVTFSKDAAGNYIMKWHNTLLTYTGKYKTSNTDNVWKDITPVETYE